MKIPNRDIYETCKNIAWGVDKRGIPSYPLQQDSKGLSLILTKELANYLINNDMFKRKENNDLELILEIPKGTYMEKIDNDDEDIANGCDRFIIHNTNLELVFPLDNINSKTQSQWKHSWKPDLMKVDLLKEMILKGCIN